MSSYELEKHLQELAMENPAMELRLPEKAPEINAEEFGRRIQWLEENDRQNAIYVRSDADEDEADPLACAGTDGGLEADLYTHLISQLDRLYSRHPSYSAARFIAGCLDEHGYLDESEETLADESDFPPEALRDGLALLHTLDPPGVAASSLSQCLVLQLQRMGETGYVLDIAANYLDSLSRQRYKFIASELDISLAQVADAAEKIRNLEPRPGESFKRTSPCAYILPDIFVAVKDGRPQVSTNADAVPRLKISSYYKQLQANTADPDVRDYLDEKIRQVRFAMRSIAQRQSTLLDCVRRIAERQEAFFLEEGCLVPMTHADIAEDLGIHSSTVSRTIREKYLDCSRGIYPLSYFFSRAMGDVGARGVSKLLLELINGEDKAHPLSDQKLCDRLAESGCRISRRTVAKYRDSLGIPDATRRKL